MWVRYLSEEPTIPSESGNFIALREEYILLSALRSKGTTPVLSITFPEIKIQLRIIQRKKIGIVLLE
jgi:hypothetical protein